MNAWPGAGHGDHAGGASQGHQKDHRPSETSTTGQPCNVTGVAPRSDRAARRPAGMRIPVFAPERIAADCPDDVLVRPPNLRGELLGGGLARDVLRR
jgi:hypothetical protein